MPLNRLWRSDVLSDPELDEEEIAKVEIQILKLHDDLDVFQGSAWERLADMLDEEFRRASEQMMQTDDVSKMLIARDRARFVSQLRNRPREIEQQLAELRAHRAVLKGESEEE